jgi:capsular polysaccharide biosynthesis protein
MILANFIKVLRKEWKFVFVSCFLVAALTFAVSAFLTPKYETKASILVIQKQPTDKVDAFSAAKSAEYLSDIFSKVNITDSFIDDVLKSPIGVKNQYSSDKEERKKEWDKEVKVKKVNNTGIIEISVYDASRQESQKVAQAITWNLSTNNTKYHGGGDSIILTPIDGPALSKDPVPNIWLDTLVGFVVGFLGAAGILYFKKRDFIEQNEDYYRY